MYDIKQFRPAMYMLVMLGMFGFALASESPGALLLGGGGVAINAWLVKTRRFRPLPRWLANLLTLGAAALIFARLGTATPILLICEFLMILQIIKLFEQRANRDYAQLLVLSLLLMVASIINTASLLFALIFVAYMFLALYCCLLFHLKVEAEHAKQLMGLNRGSTARLATPMTLRQDQRLLPSSMRKLTLLVSVYAVTIGVLVFLFFPRGAGAGMMGLQFKPPHAETGYTPEADFQRASSIGQNTTIVGHVSVTVEGQAKQLGEVYLRGATLDLYDSNPESPNRWQWSRSNASMTVNDARIRVGTQIDFPKSNSSLDQEIVQQVMLQPMPDPTLFAIAGAYEISPLRDIAVTKNSIDQTVRLSQPLLQPLKYSVRSSGIGFANASEMSRSFPRSVVSPRVAQLARTLERDGQIDQSHAQRVQQLTPGRVTQANIDVARGIEHFLRTNFRYSLDVTALRKVDDDGDPMERFLFDFKQGHCQYFASAMVLMCQALDMPARYVSGFRTSEYNSTPGAGYFIIRQSHAHAWVEVLGPSGWITFDPTSSDEVEAAIGQTSGLFQSVKHFLDLLQFTWANNVVAYDQGSRMNLIEQLGSTMDQTAAGASNQISDWFRLPRKGDGENWLDSVMVHSLTMWAIVGLLTLLGVGVSLAVVVFVVQRIRLHRRAKRIGLLGLDADLQRQLARQLGFYDRLLTLLEQRGSKRPPHLTPREFASQLSQLPAESYQSINRLTDIYYRIRYGQQSLSTGQQRRLDRVVDQIERTM